MLWMNSYGRRSFVCWTIRRWFRTKSTAAEKQRGIPIHYAHGQRNCAGKGLDWKGAANAWINAYQEALLTLPQLRHRMPELRKQVQAVESELQSLELAAADQAKYLQLAESLAAFRSKLRLRAETLDIQERQQILRLLVKEVLVSPNTITDLHHTALQLRYASRRTVCVERLVEWRLVATSLRPAPADVYELFIRSSRSHRL
jgi:hypothetical protein